MGILSLREFSPCDEYVEMSVVTQGDRLLLGGKSGQTWLFNQSKDLGLRTIIIKEC